MTNNYLLKISKFFLYLAPFSVAIVYQGTLFPFIVGKYVFFRTVVDLALVFFVWAWAIQPTYNKQQITNNNNKNQLTVISYKLLVNPLVVAVALFTLIFVLAGFFGVNSAASFWSNFERGEGSLQLIHLFIFFALLVATFRDEKSWRKMFIVLVGVAALVIGYGLAGALNIGNFIGSNLCLRFSGSLGNAAYTGTYLIFAIFYAVYLANEDAKKNIKWLWLGLAGLFFIFLLFTQTRGALLGLGMAVIAGLTYLFFSLPKGKIKKVILLLIVLLVVSGGLAIKYRRSINIMPFCSAEIGGGNRILDVDFGTETFQTRLLLWKESVEAFKERPIFGWGPENFTVAFEKYYQPQFTTWYDRAHNIFFDYLVMTGMLGLISFLGIFGIYYWQFFKFNQQSTTNNNKNQLSVISYKSLVGNALLFALPIAYLVQGLVLFDVLSIYINIFLFLAFVNWKFSNRDSLKV